MAFVVDLDAALDRELRIRAAELNTGKSKLAGILLAESLSVPVSSDTARAVLTLDAE